MSGLGCTAFQISSVQLVGFKLLIVIVKEIEIFIVIVIVTVIVSLGASRLCLAGTSRCPRNGGRGVKGSLNIWG